MKTSSHKRAILKTNRFGKDIKKIPQSIQKKAFNISKILADDIFNPQLNVHKLTGFNSIFRVVVKGDYRMVFSFDTDNLYLLRIAHRKDIYRKLEL
ncbi:MAG: hypothetical protein IIB44_00625 [Candidatus Marinimicrobia bacterium]|nr:hypothetical protein [Candidatus Neomarinimicrobiota bacterium]MCH8069938.1 hypothetical protein [Candidatus Neomarinimicrobiota bacterium]